MKHTFLFLLTFVVLLLPVVALAQVKYAPLIEIEGLTNSVQGESFSQYVNFLYGFSIAIAALLAVIKIIIAGVKYMLSSLPGSKGDAKTEIQGALLGLLLILGAYLILNTINPALTNTAIQFDPVDPPKSTVNRPGARVVGGTPGGAQSTLGQFDTGFPSCATPRPGTSGNFDTRSLNTTGCSSEDRQRAILRFNSLCDSLGGRGTDGNDTNSQTLGCAIPRTTTASPTGGQTTTQSLTDAANRCIGTPTIRQQGTVRYNYWNLSDCGTARSTAETMLRDICKPNALLQGSSGEVYCKI